MNDRWRWVRYLAASAIVWLAVAVGYAVRGGVGEWLAEIHSGSLGSQIHAIAFAGLRVGVSLVTFLVTFGGVVLIAFFAIALAQEAWYQLFTRRILSLWFRPKSAAEDADPFDDVPTIGAPKRPVKASKHARRAGGNGKPPRKPRRSLMNRIRQLEASGIANAKAESDDDEMRVMRDDD